MKLIILIALLGFIAMFAIGGSRLITSGQHIIATGTTVRGFLIVSSGQIVVEEGARIDGSVLMSSGDLQVLGEVKGSILMSSGRVYVGPGATVHGSIRGSSGTVHQAEGARVLGNISTNPGGAGIGMFLAAAGAAIYYFVTMGRSRATTSSKEKQAVADWNESPSSEKSGYI